MWMRATRWAVAALIGSAMTAVGCSTPPVGDAERVREREAILADDSLVHAFDTSIETRLVDRLELDNFLRHRSIRVRVADGMVNITGEVWTPLEKERVGELVRSVAGVIDVANDLDIPPPR